MQTNTKANESLVGLKDEDAMLIELPYEDFKLLIEDSVFFQSFKNDLVNRKNNSDQQKEIKFYIQSNFEEYDSAYRQYPKKAKCPKSDRVLISFPLNMEKLYSPLFTSYVERNRICEYNDSLGGYSYYIFMKNEKVQFDLSMHTEKNARRALFRTIMESRDRAIQSVAPSTWRQSVKVVDTPFDFTFNYFVKAHTKERGDFCHYSIMASYYNLDITFKSDIDENEQDSLITIQPIFNQIVQLFHGFETKDNIKKTDYLDLNPQIVKNEQDESSTTFKIACNFKNVHKEMKDKCWLLAVSNSGDLSIEKAEFKALTGEFRSKSYSLRFVNQFFKDARDVPDIVYLTLPAGKKSTELTFYFISEDSTQYSSQSITLTVPEAEKKPTPTK